MDKVYWSGTITDDWNQDHDVMTFFYIPNKWWSWKAWKLARDFGFDVHKKLLLKYLDAKGASDV